MNILHIGNALGGGGAENVFAMSIEQLRIQAPDTDQHFVATCAELYRHEALSADLTFRSWTAKSGASRASYFYSPDNANRLQAFLLKENVDLIHLHGFLATISPSILTAIRSYRKQKNLRVVQTVHSHELICANASAYDWNQNRPCTDCIGQSLKLKIFHRNCDRRGWLHSWGKGLRHLVYRSLLQHPELVDLYLAPSKFVMRLLIDEGIPGSRISLLPDPVAISTAIIPTDKTNKIVYFGRLSQEKNIPLLLTAFARLASVSDYEELQLAIIGSGEQEQELAGLINAHPFAERITCLPFMKPADLHLSVADARVMVIPSNALETFSLVIPEAISMGMLPVASDLGAMTEMIQYLGCGYTFKSGDPESLTRRMQQALSEYDQVQDTLLSAHQRLRSEFGTQTHVRRLMAIYTDLTNSPAQATGW